MAVLLVLEGVEEDTAPCNFMFTGQAFFRISHNRQYLYFKYTLSVLTFMLTIIEPHKDGTFQYTLASLLPWWNAYYTFCCAIIYIDSILYEHHQ